MSAKHAAALGEFGRPLSLMGDALLGMHDCMRRNPRVFPSGEHQTFVDLAKRVFLLAEPTGVPRTPKFHLMLHLARRSGFQGNPLYYHTFLDEGYNGKLAKVAAGCHRLTFYPRLLATFKRSFSKAAKARRTM